MSAEHDDAPPPHFIQRWFSIGDAISLAAMLVALGVTYGSLSKDVDSIKQDVAELRAQRITPGAEIALAQVQSRDANQDQQLSELRNEMQEQRREILSGIKAIEAKLDSHMDRAPR